MNSALSVAGEKITKHYRGDPWGPLRALIKGCSLVLLEKLPAVAHRWVEAADAYTRAEMSAEALTGVRVEAWKFHDLNRGVLPEEVLSGLRAVMYGLWPSKDSDWREDLEYFIEFCQDSGMEDQAILYQMNKAFPEA